MVLLRSSLYFLSLILTTLIFGLGMSTIGLALPLGLRDRMANTWARSNIWFMKWLLGLDYRIQGEEHLPSGPAIIMSKHQSAWETISLRGILPPSQSWVLKRELTWIPVFGWALAAVPNIAIDRKSGRKAVRKIIERGTELLKQGRTIIIFPEGTRTQPGERHKYGIGGGLLAEHSGYPVIPVALNAGVFWPRRSFLKYPGTIDMVVGPPIETKGKKASQITREVEAWIESKMTELPLERKD